MADSTESPADPPYVDIRLPFGGNVAEKEKALKAESKELCMMLEKLFSIRTHASTAGFDCHTTCIDEMIQETTLLMGKTAKRLARVRGAPRVVVEVKPSTCDTDEPCDADAALVGEP